MTTDTNYELLTTTIQEAITEPWTIAQLTVQYLISSDEIEFSGTYLDGSGEAQVLQTEFSDEVVEALHALFTIRASEGRSPSNRLEFNISAQGRFTTDYTWDQEIQDEDDHFMKGGTVKEWIKIREAKYGPLPDSENPL